MTSETRKLVTERYTTWSETWGMSFAFAVTQSVEKSERIIADAIVALVAAVTEQEGVAMVEARLAQYRRDKGAEITDELPVKAKPAPLLHGITATRFAAVIWEMANAQAYRGFGIDPFFRMPAIARAVVIMKTKAQFSRQQIAGVLRITAFQVDDHLENARLLFSDGRPWIEASPALTVNGIESATWSPECPQWNSAAPRQTSEEGGKHLQDIFAQYVGNDLDVDTGQRLHSHLIVCTACRSNFSHFKKQYSDWSTSIPMIETAPEMRKHLKKVTKMALKVKRHEAGDAPKALPGLNKILRRTLRDGQIRAMVYGATAVMFFQFYFHKHSLLPHFIRRFFH